jgi:hypothetical protein
MMDQPQSSRSFAQGPTTAAHLIMDKKLLARGVGCCIVLSRFFNRHDKWNHKLTLH